MSQTKLSSSFVILSSLLLAGCMMANKLGGTVNATSSPAESVVATVTSLADESEGASFTDDLRSEDSQVAIESAQCKASAAKSSCNSSNQIQMNWNGCALKGGGEVSGSWTNTYNNMAACSTAQGGTIGSGQSVTRTSSGITIKGVYGGAITWNTNRHTAFDSTTISDAGLTLSRSGDARTLTISGLHRSLEDDKGNKAYDHSIVSLSPVMISGSRAMGTRTVSGGTVRVYNNTEGSIAENSFNLVRWGLASCAFPTSGSIATTYSGNKAGTSQLTFKIPCGSASVRDANGAETQVVLKQVE